MTVRTDTFLAAFDRRVNGALPQSWPTLSAVRSSAVSSHFSGADPLALNEFPIDVALHYIDRDVLRVRFGRLPRHDPDAGWLVAELEPIPLEEIIASG